LIAGIIGAASTPTRMPEAAQHLENAARDPVLALYGLIGIGTRA
jgi:hypothetical protein